MNDKWIRINGYPVVILISAMIYHGDALWGSWTGALHALLISGTFTVIIWEGNRRIFWEALRRYPGYVNTAKRILMEVLLCLLYSTLVQILIELVLFYFLDLHPDGAPPVDWWSCVLSSLLMLIPLGLLYEASYFFAEWKRNIQQSEALARSQIQAQLDALKKQLDPHFLFNSLNTLAFLIDLDNEPAQEYLSRLSDVYRYVLDTRHRTTVSLADEVAFLDDYLYLNQVRYQQNLEVVKELSPDSHRQQIPALSLQLLVENALKHNVVSQAQPLHIHISSDEQGLQVRNNKQPKTGLVASTQVGLQNLREQYRLLTARPIEVLDEAHQFTVRLPFVGG